MFDFESVQQLRQTGQYEAAKVLVRQYVETAPNDPIVLYQMAWCHDSLGEEHTAVPYYEQALALGLTGEDRLQAYIGLGSTYRVIGQFEVASDVFHRALREFPDAHALQAFLAMTEYNLGQADQAVGRLLKTLATTSSDTSIQTFDRAIRYYADHLDEIVKE
ncbi:tetratricopeptide repeat protein [Exiguobacterium sp. s168]|uniref:tetratricopeptide repeat protein n=1 Tax=Exiguobacterium sp. s168 TaxID=2751194 RepID=UPI001BE91135|nr:tetratricopeptide repeat protein [Exiguobacterium sp. s168]